MNTVRKTKNMLRDILLDIFGNHKGFSNDDVLTAVMVIFTERNCDEERKTTLMDNLPEEVAVTLIEYYTNYSGGVKVR